MQYHRLLDKQLSKFAGALDPENELLLQLLKAVNDSYKAYEHDKALSQQAFEHSMQEYLETNQRLKEEIALKNQSLNKLKDALKNIETEGEGTNAFNEDNILDILGYLDIQISRRKEAELALLKAKEEAEKANHAKTEFLSVMSHEIRTPLNAVIGMGHLLLKADPRPDQLQNLNVLKASAENLLLLINDVLDFNKIEAGKLELEQAPFALTQLVHDIKAGNQVSAADQNTRIDLVVDDNLPPMVVGDSLRLRQILTNLVSNAIKFTRNGTIRLEVKLLGETPEDVEVFIAVHDTGIGIEADKFLLIFDRFAQASNTITRKYGGTGLGLTITKNLLQLMGSTIHVTSEPGVGSTFYFNLKLGKALGAENIHHSEEDTDNVDLHKARILLVEDTLFNVLYATQLLSDWNTEVDVAENGIDAIQQAENKPYDIILMDLLMPEMDGYAAARQLRTMGHTTPIIALTASAGNNVKQRVLDAGMQDYISKPISPSDLLSKIKKYI